MILTEEKILKYIILSEMNGIGPVSQNALLDVCGDIDRCFMIEEHVLSLADEISRIGKKRITSFVSQRNDKVLRTKAEIILEASYKLGIDVIVREDERYPKRFVNVCHDNGIVNDLPVLIYTKGTLKINEYKDSVGIVGARRCTADGKTNAIRIAAEEVKKNAAVVSGMAKGIDSYAHTAAIKEGGYTIAVLGNSPEICYPKEHEKLYEEISQNGCILSEYPLGTEPREYLFPKRNRLIAALSDKLYVIDAGRISGTKTTVENAEKYGKKIYMLG